MQCPACTHELSPKKAGEITVDVCENGCGGIWFDQNELNKFDEPHEPDEGGLCAVKPTTKVGVGADLKRQCPRCKDIVMMKHKFSVERKITIDECAGCGGIWLDAGELVAIRALFASEADRKEAANQYFKNFIQSGPAGEAMDEEKEKLQKAQKIANALKYACLSYYIPGDDAWGAF